MTWLFLGENIERYTNEIKELQKRYCWNHEGDNIVGIRFEDKSRVVGEELGCSKHNIDREYEDEMPEYGTEEYEDLYELDGISTLDVDHFLRSIKMGASYQGKHMYFVVGESTANESDALDDGELVITDAKVGHIFTE